MRHAFALLLLACGSDPGQRAAEDARYTQAQLAFDHGRDAQAIEQFTTLARDTEDPQLAAVALYRVAQVHERRDDRDAARAAYQRVVDGPDVERGALAAYQIARLDPDPRAMRTVAERFPDTAAADKAVRHIARETAFDTETLAWLNALAIQHADHTVADNALWAAAHGQVFQLGDLAGARATLRRLVEGRPESLLIDDALNLLCAIYVRQGAFGAALETGEALLRVRSEQGMLVGSYRSIYLDDMALLTGELAYHALRDFSRAVFAYRRVLDEFPTSVHRDDAWFGLAHAYHASGDQDAAASALRGLLDEFPDSRFAGEARALLGGGGTWRPPTESAIEVALMDPKRSRWP